MNIGIDKIGFYTPHLYVDMNKLAEARGDDPAKYTIGIGQEKMALAPITQDAVTLAANAALSILTAEDKEKIDYVIFATESGVDNSKAAAVFVHGLLGLKPNVRSVEVKEACFAATAGVQMARGHIALNPDSKVLVLGSDISRYGLHSSGEVTQGAGAVAMLISRDPGILVIENENSCLTEDIMDFWRPIYSDSAYVKGKYSNEKFISFFQQVWADYKEKTGRKLNDFEAICFHMPYTKMGLKALKSVLDEGSIVDKERLLSRYEISKGYNKVVGNIYTGSLYLSLISLLELNSDLESGSRIGLYSYGSGAVGEFLTGILQPNYRENLFPEQHQNLLDERREVSVSEYEKIYQEVLPKDGSHVTLPIDEDPATICLAGVKEHERIYVNKQHN